MSHHFLEIEHNNTEFLTRHIEQLNDIKKEQLFCILIWKLLAS